ncbi:MAG: helix-turn-helix domain-containing protein [Syntrophobacterales bacterium]|nr:helix-turn-helix domain-containing protein [Syntrophobacterales bacterium]
MDKWLTLEQIAEYLQMSTSSIYKMAQAGKIPTYKVGRQWRFKKEVIDKWIEQQKYSKKRKYESKKIIVQSKNLILKLNHYAL